MARPGSENIPREIILIDSSSDQIDHLKANLPEYNFHCVCTEEIESDIEGSLSKDVDAVIVYTPLQKERRVLDLCKQIKGVSSFKSIPLLVAINRFQMMLGNDVKHLPNGHYLLTPIETDVLQQRIIDLQNDN